MQRRRRNMDVTTSTYRGLGGAVEANKMGINVGYEFWQIGSSLSHEGMVIDPNHPLDSFQSQPRSSHRPRFPKLTYDAFFAPTVGTWCDLCNHGFANHHERPTTISEMKTSHAAFFHLSALSLFHSLLPLFTFLLSSFLFFSPNSVSTQTGSYGRVHAVAWLRCPLWGAAFHCKFGRKMSVVVSCGVHVHFDCPGSREVWVTALCVKQFVWHVHVSFHCTALCKTCGTALVYGVLLAKMICKIALVACPCTFRLPWLAQNLRRMSGARHFFTVNLRKKLSLWHVHAHFECAKSHTMWFAVSGSLWGAAFCM